MAPPVKVTDATFDQEVLKASGAVLVDFYADWCGPCHMMAPIIEQIANEYEGKVKVCKLDVDQNRQTASRYNIMSIPTLMFVKNGELADTQIGMLPRERLKERLDKLAS